MVRTRSQRAAMLLRLPTDVLLKIASHVVAPGLVVAAGKNLEARTALRKGTDVAERSRFGGTIGLTVREAEHRLRGPYMRNGPPPWPANCLEASDLETRRAAGLALVKAIPVGSGTYPDDELAIALIAYGADVNAMSARVRRTILHVAYKARDPLRLARILIAAGADLDARCAGPDGAGLSPLSWTIECGFGAGQSYELASFLIEQGCDVSRPTPTSPIRAHTHLYSRPCRASSQRLRRHASWNLSAFRSKPQSQRVAKRRLMRREDSPLNLAPMLWKRTRALILTRTRTTSNVLTISKPRYLDEL